MFESGAKNAGQQKRRMDVAVQGREFQRREYTREELEKLLSGVEQIFAGDGKEGGARLPEFTESDFAGLTIQTKVEGQRWMQLRFVLNGAQKILLGEINGALREGRDVRKVLLKARQFGGSTFFVAVAFFLVMRFGYRAVIMAQDIEAANTLFKKFKLFYEKWLDVEKPGLVTKGRREYTFSNGGELWVGSAGVKSLRSQTNMFILVTELPQWKCDIEESMTAVLNTLAEGEGTFCIFESTARGYEEFHRRYVEAKAGESEYDPIFVGWTQIEKYQKAFDSVEKRVAFMETLDNEEEQLSVDFGCSPEQLFWRRWCIANKCSGSVELFHQEYPTTDCEAFAQSGRPVFSPLRIGEMIRNAREPVFVGEINPYSGANWKRAGKEGEDRERGFRADRNGRFKVWEWPEPYVDYGIGTDVSEGLELNKKSDSSAFSIIKKSTAEIVATWIGKVPPEELADIITDMGTCYNVAFQCVEANNHGMSVLLRLEKQYPRSRIYAHQEGVEEGYHAPTKRLGFWSSGKSHVWVVDNLAIAIRLGEIEIHDKDMLTEMSGILFEQDGKVKTKGKDRLMSLAFAWEAHCRGSKYQKKPAGPEENWKSVKRYRKELRETAAQQKRCRDQWAEAGL